MTLDCYNTCFTIETNERFRKQKRLYTEEARKYFNGNIYVPDDLDVIEL